MVFRMLIPTYTKVLLLSTPLILRHAFPEIDKRPKVILNPMKQCCSFIKLTSFVMLEFLIS